MSKRADVMLMAARRLRHYKSRQASAWRALEFAGDTPEFILTPADEALYCAKRGGRNRVVAKAA